MNRLYSSLLAATALTFTAAAQQLPNAGFEDGWADYTPWTSAGNTTKQGTAPESWKISHVAGLLGQGKTTVGEKVEGYNSNSAVKVYNSTNTAATDQIVPGYATLGTPWSTAVGMKANNKDGGTFGGISFNGRPEKITFMYKFERSSANSQPANAIVYLWKGTYVQADVPGNIALMSSGLKKVNMQNRDRNILDMTTSQGGSVTQKGELIAEGKLVITETTSEWTNGEIVLDYKSDATPEMINVIFAANDYFNSENIIAGNALTVDNVECVYPTEEVDPNTKIYPGKISVKVEAMDIDMKDEDATVHIIPNTDYTNCTILLPNFTLDGMEVGDIKVDDVKITRENSGYSFDGYVENLSLAEGNIIADVTIKGNIDASGNVSMDITVQWHSGMPSLGDNGEVPIFVAFNGKGDAFGTSAIGGIESDVIDENAPVEYYNIQGMKVNADNLAPGFYIVRQGKKVSKIFVK